MPIKVMFWNVENFSGDPARTQEVVAHVAAFDPDVIGFSEIKDKVALRGILMNSLASHDFGVTDGRQGIELLAGWRRGKFQQAIFTQRREFKADNPFLRPGSLLSVKNNDKFYNMLFLHTDSGRTLKDYENRQMMFEKTFTLKEKLSEISSDGDARLLAMGDLNTMGRKRIGASPAISGDEEITELKRDAAADGMSLPKKTHSKTWARVNGQGDVTLSSDLDHVVASDTLSFAAVRGQDTFVRVRGWVDVNAGGDRRRFVEEVSDHSSIEVTIED